MTDAVPPAPVPGQVAQPQQLVDIVAAFKRGEEQLLRELDVLEDTIAPHRFDPRWLAIARTQFEQAYMALNRAILRPSRIRLPGDEKPE